MAGRVNVGILPDADWIKIKREMLNLGALDVREPSDVLPDVFVVTLEPDSDADQFCQAVKNLAGVRYAEPDAWSWTY